MAITNTAGSCAGRARCCATASRVGRQSRAGVEGRWNVARQPAGSDQHGIEANVADAVVRKAREPGFGGADNAGALALGDRPGRVIELFARLDLDEHQEMPAPRDDVDLAERASEAARQDAKAFCDQDARRPAL